MEPFWRDMIRTGLSGYEGARFFGKEDDLAHPIWAARRFGQSLTFLPDGRIIQIAGEHEDSYDPDFCIYNDVFVHHPDGGIDVCGYPEDVFPPTDFHTATLVNKRYIWIIGSLGYRDYRQPGVTPVYRLDTQSLRMERMEVAGSGPGWISSHRARLLDQTKIEVSGGQVAILGADGRGDLVANPKTAVLETSTVRWLD
jgi:hypothetical protein